MFLKRGFEGASVDEIADVARAGKPTIYARFPGKEALFAAVMARTCAKSPAPSRALHRRVPRLKNVWRHGSRPGCKGGPHSSGTPALRRPKKKVAS